VSSCYSWIGSRRRRRKVEEEGGREGGKGVRIAIVVVLS